jgi:hypothetical protein
MRTIKLLKAWLGHYKDDILQVDNNVAFGLVDSGTATYDLTLRQSYIGSETTKEMRFDKKRIRGYKIK